MTDPIVIQRVKAFYAAREQDGKHYKRREISRDLVKGDPRYVQFVEIGGVANLEDSYQSNMESIRGAMETTLGELRGNCPEDQRGRKLNKEYAVNENNERRFIKFASRAERLFVMEGIKKRTGELTEEFETLRLLDELS